MAEEVHQSASKYFVVHESSAQLLRTFDVRLRIFAIQLVQLFSHDSID